MINNTNIYYTIIIVIILLFLFKPRSFCNCENFDQKIVRNNCSELKNEGNLIHTLQAKTCNIGSQKMTDRERISTINNCRDFTEMQIFNNRESTNWCTTLPEPNTPKSLGNNKVATIQPHLNNDVYPAIGKIVLNGNYHLIGQIEPPKDTVLSELKLDAYTDIKPKNYAYKV